MKKIKSIFVRDFSSKGGRLVTPEITKGCEWVFKGEGAATLKMDGTCCMVKDGELYKRYDAKHGKVAPEGAIPCQEADPITGHHPHWLKVDRKDPADKWFVRAWDSLTNGLVDGTYELYGPRFRNNPHKLEDEQFYKHGSIILENVPRTYEGLKEWFATQNIEGIVFHHESGEMCKIKRSDFGYEWNSRE